MSVLSFCEDVTFVDSVLHLLHPLEIRDPSDRFFIHLSPRDIHFQLKIIAENKPVDDLDVDEPD